MSYKVLTASNATLTVELQREGTALDPILINTVECGEDYQTVIDAAANSMIDIWKIRMQERQNAKSSKGPAIASKDKIEGEISTVLFSHLRELPTQVLSDPGLWRYLGAWHLFDFVEWRDGDKCKLESFGAGSVRPTWDCAPLRMFVRAKICAEGAVDNWEDLCAVPGTDLWRSHILRVKTGNFPLLSCCLVQSWREGEVNTASVREVAKGLKRMRSNIVFEFLNPIQTRSIVHAEIDKARLELESSE